MLHAARTISCALALSMLVACGRKQEVPAPPSTSGDAQAPSATAAPPPQQAGVPEERPTAGWPSADQERAQVQALIQQIRSSPGDSRERLGELQRRLDQIDRYERQPENLQLPPEWRETYRVAKNGPEADLLVQVGDIDNLGFGWPSDFDPFAGKSTPVHPYPWRPEADDPDGTDRVMVISGMKHFDTARRDGYTDGTSRPHNTPRAIAIEFPLDGVEIKSAALQLFVDDFQAPVHENRFKVSLDGQNAPDLAATINRLQQTGPIGKLLTVQLLPEYLKLLADGKLAVLADDPDTNAGDGFAFDFVRLLINPKPWKYAGTVRGIAVEAGTGTPLPGVLVSAANVKQMQTNAEGKFELSGVPAGLVVTSASHPDYLGDSEQADLEAGQTVDILPGAAEKQEHERGARAAARDRRQGRPVRNLFRSRQSDAQG